MRGTHGILNPQAGAARFTLSRVAPAADLALPTASASTRTMEQKAVRTAAASSTTRINAREEPRLSAG